MIIDWALTLAGTLLTAVNAYLTLGPPRGRGRHRKGGRHRK